MGGVGSGYPRPENPDLGHPSMVAGQEKGKGKNNRGSFTPFRKTGIKGGGERKGTGPSRG